MASFTEIWPTLLLSNGSFLNTVHFYEKLNIPPDSSYSELSFGMLNGWVNHSWDETLISLLIRFIFHMFGIFKFFSYLVRTLYYYSSLYHISLVLG